ncbi:NAD(P)-dependent dehydrogenase, short-chain alcohol dehydrogenase family [Pustulibacterium marinum]|uniref:NAD(P)-dependent dehydrogenase, short-chain alcohol dehydrogenase family n=1 Tax=Pustulibacterium marinum TaxID=1224947 RepID=A0A1I7IBS2_9FLAO|nr:SDR family oxidoreductase [Pustulibacterium marinum]SFU70276.1 NAD(P)-dependent dehydrogenase, short-chain alcohol dehydrogenase family [Pustulibacterium marinum]
MNSRNKIAVVTGGSRGLGKDMVLNLAENGLDVIFTYHSNETMANEVVDQIKKKGQKAIAYQLDTSDISQFDSFITKVTSHLKEATGSPNFDFLVNNAGTALYAMVATTTEEQMDAAYNIHYKGVFFLTQKALPYLNEGGGIVNISSGLARFSFPGSSVYGSLKAAIDSLSRYMAKELGAKGIRVNSVAPGAIATDFGGGSNREADKQQIIAGATALGRVGEPDDIGGVVAFLCSDKAKWVNGQRIEVSGGMML